MVFVIEIDWFEFHDYYYSSTIIMIIIYDYSKFNDYAMLVICILI